MKKKKEPKPQPAELLSEEQVEKVSEKILELIEVMCNNGFTRKQCMKMLAFTVVDALNPPLPLRDEFCEQFVKFMHVAFEIEDASNGEKDNTPDPQVNKTLNMCGVVNIGCDQTGATFQNITDGPQRSESFESATRQVKQVYCAKLMKEMLPKFQEAFIKWYIPSDLKVDVFCVMLAQLIPMPKENYVTMANYVKNALLIAYQTTEEVKDKPNEDGQQE